MLELSIIFKVSINITILYLIICFQIAGKKAQIINLGSGFDTTFWRLKSNNVKFKKFIDVDFKIVTSRKSFIIYHNKLLKDLVSGNIRVNSSDLHSDDYHLVGKFLC